jgi:hypothetical protein
VFNRSRRKIIAAISRAKIQKARQPSIGVRAGDDVSGEGSAGIPIDPRCPWLTIRLP